MFPVVKRIIEKITGKESVYQSPTDMGVNRVGFGIIDDDAVKEASKAEIIRRYFATLCDFKKGQCDEEVVNRMKVIMEEVGLKPEDRVVVPAARKCAEEKDTTAVVALQLEDGKIVTGKRTDLMDACAAMLLNAVKYLANISESQLLLAPSILNTICDLKERHLDSKMIPLTANEVLIALSICAVTNPMAQTAVEGLAKLKDAQAHSTVMLNRNDEQTLKKLGIDVTCDPEYASENLFYN